MFRAKLIAIVPAVLLFARLQCAMTIVAAITTMAHQYDSVFASPHVRSWHFVDRS